MHLSYTSQNAREQQADLRSLRWESIHTRTPRILTTDGDSACLSNFISAVSLRIQGLRPLLKLQFTLASWSFDFTHQHGLSLMDVL